jgi:spore coat polysaccharide biosynthesis protein SpsF
VTDQREKAVAFVVARLSSSRLPSKQLRTIGGKPIIDRIMSSLAGCEELDQVVLATVAEPDNEPLRERALEKGWECFWYQGEVDDVVGRLVSAAKAYDADICLLISADCPLVYGPGVDEMVCQLRQHPESDYVGKPTRDDGSVLLLEGVQVARRRAWEKADQLSNRPELREHQFPVVYRDPDQFHRLDVFLDRSLYGKRHRLSIDTWADLEFMETLSDQLAGENVPFDLPHVVASLERQPALREINAHVHQRGLVENNHEVLFVVDVGGPFGYGHFMRCRELAGQLVERLGWPVTFLLDDVRAADMAGACGFRVSWGALGRVAQPKPDQVGDTTEIDRSACLQLIVVDLSARRTLEVGWRERMSSAAFVVVMDREDKMAEETDLIVYPGVSGRHRESREHLPPILEGTNYVILRRELCRYTDCSRQKDIDLLVYLQEPEKLAMIEAATRHTDLRIEYVEGLSKYFPAWLCRSRAFLSGYGQSFYEALALGASPIAWPYSELHRQDAEAFYSAVGLKPLIIDTADQLTVHLGGDGGNAADCAAKLIDGTPKIVAAIRDRMAAI